MRITLLNQNARSFGGVEGCVRDLAIGLGDRGHEVTLGHADMSPAKSFLAPFARTLDLREVPVPSAASRLLEARPDVVYVHKWERPDLVDTLRRRVAVVMMVHDHDLTCPRRHRYTLVGRRNCTRPMGLGCLPCAPFVERVPGSRTLRFRSLGARVRWLKLLRQLPLVVVASQAMARTLALNGVDRRRVSVVPPVPRDPVPAEAPAYAPEGHLLFVGQLVRTKGWDLLLEAYAGLEDPPPLVLAGTGNDESRVKLVAAAHRWRDRIRIRGWTAPADLTQLYRDASVVVVPSRWQEPFGLVGLEAMAQARPVVAFAIGGIPSWLEHERTGLLVPAGDVGAFTAALQRVLADPVLAAMLGRAGHRARRERFDIERNLISTEKLLVRATVLRALKVVSWA